MRLAEIRSASASGRSIVPTGSHEDISARVVRNVRIATNEPLKRRMLRAFAPGLLQARRRSLERVLGFPLSFHADALCMEERFGSDASTAAMLRVMGAQAPQRVLVPGCYLGGEDVQFWLRRGARRVDGIDLNCLDAHWREIVPALRDGFGSEVAFTRGALERLPFADASFDVVASAGVLEHVRDIEAVSAETARVLKPGGLAWHSFGPLYFAFGADHCIAAFGDHCGYDHLLLAEDEYLGRIWDQRFFDRQQDPNLPFWARNGQFSYATAREYLDSFGKHFEICHVLAKISGKGLEFRRSFRDKWASLIAAGVAEEDLLVKGLCVVLRKPVRIGEGAPGPRPRR